MPLANRRPGVTPLQAVQRALKQSGRHLPTVTDDEIRKFIRWLETLTWSQLCGLAAYCLQLARQKREENRKSLRQAD